MVRSRPFLWEDINSFVHRPPTAGLLDAVVRNPEVAALMSHDAELEATVKDTVSSIDAALSDDDLEWLVGLMDQVNRHTVSYDMIDALEEVVDADVITWVASVCTPARLAAAAPAVTAAVAGGPAKKPSAGLPQQALQQQRWRGRLLSVVAHAIWEDPKARPPSALVERVMATLRVLLNKDAVKRYLDNAEARMTPAGVTSAANTIHELLSDGGDAEALARRALPQELLAAALEGGPAGGAF